MKNFYWIIVVCLYCSPFVGFAQHARQVAKESIKLEELRKEHQRLPRSLQANLDIVHKKITGKVGSGDERSIEVFKFIGKRFEPIAEAIRRADATFPYLDTAFLKFKENRLSYTDYRTLFIAQNKQLMVIAKHERVAAIRIFLKLGLKRDPIISSMVDEYMAKLKEEGDNLKGLNDTLILKNQKLGASNEDLKKIQEEYERTQKNIEKSNKERLNELEEKKDSLNHLNRNLDDLNKAVSHLDTKLFYMSGDSIKRRRELQLLKDTFRSVSRKISDFKASMDTMLTMLSEKKDSLKSTENALFLTIDSLESLQKEIGDLRHARGIEKEQTGEIKRLWIAVICLLLLILFIQYLRNQNTKKMRNKTVIANKELKKANNDLAVANRQLQEKGALQIVLMKELHHRIKNNLQSITSLMGLQADELEDTSAKEILMETRSRIDALAVLHKLLYQDSGQNFTHVQLADYIHELVDYLTKSNMKTTVGIHKRLDLEDFTIELDDATDIGLIMNELIQNCFKHAFPFTQEPLLMIKVNAAEGILFIEVGDNGPGFHDVGEIDSFGIKLVRILVEGKGGVLTTDFQDGALISIKMPVITYS